MCSMESMLNNDYGLKFISSWIYVLLWILFSVETEIAEENSANTQNTDG